MGVKCPEGKHGHPSPQQPCPAPLGASQGVIITPPMGYTTHPDSSGCALRSPNGKCQETFPGRHPAQTTEPLKLTPFNAGEQHLYSSFPGQRSSSPYLSEPVHPVEDTNFICLDPRSCSFSGYSFPNKDQSQVEIKLLEKLTDDEWSLSWVDRSGSHPSMRCSSLPQ